MRKLFRGPREQLMAAVETTGISGEWEQLGEDKCVFRSAGGGVLTWWPSKGTLQFQGPAEAKAELESSLNEVLSTYPTGGGGGAIAADGPSRRIFVVHGHDDEARDQLELVLRRLDLEPFILMNTSGGGKTIIEALEGQIGRDYSTDFGIALLTPDDVGYAKTDGPDRAEPRARQNVILETGMLLSSLTRERMALLVKGHLELPSDLQGIIRLGFNEHVREVVPKLCARLREAGIELDPGRISAASA